MNSRHGQDESRKWYSVRWADFKLCCRRLQDVSTQHPRIPFWLYALYRFALAAYFFALLITYVVLAAKTLDPRLSIYFEAWTFTAATCYVCFAFFNVVMDFVKRRKNIAFEDKFRYQIQWFLFNITATPSFIVSIFDCIYSTWENVVTLHSVGTHLLPTIICLIESFFTLIVVRFVHVVYPLSLLIMYLFFAVMYWVAGGTDPFGNPFIYFVLDFENYPGIAVATALVVSFAMLLFQAILKGLYVLRVRCMGGRRTEDVLATEEVAAVELEMENA
ncbi:protein rolling stone-like [Diadema antillarum]|uniref:protein rolling stone-like n=1 Tax=Diadema antillarum TaxID=105358 RepID=UPI003A871DCB